ncbi:MAG: DivIVA domain-containing protein, partial [Actinomycetes bacterium]
TTRMRMGYDVAQVDEFLEKVADEIASLQNELEMAHRGTSLSSSQSVDTKSPVEVLTLAQQALTAATNEAERLVREARAMAASISSSVESEKAQIEAQIKRLEAIEIDYRNRLRNWLSGMLTDLGAQLNDSIESTEPVNVITSAPENQ